MKRTVPATSSTPMTASTGRSSDGYGELVRRSMSDPRGNVRPGLPGPVEVPVRTAQIHPDERENEDDEDDAEEREVLRAACLRQPDAGGATGRSIEPGPERQDRDQQSRQDDPAEERAVDGERAKMERRVGDDLLQPQEVPGR